MKYVTWDEIEAEIEIQRSEREKKGSLKKQFKKSPQKKREYIHKDLYLNNIQEKILKTLKENGDMNREELVVAIKSPRTILFDNLSKLAGMELIKSYSPHNRRRGRPQILWSVDMK